METWISLTDDRNLKDSLCSYVVLSIFLNCCKCISNMALLSLLFMCLIFTTSYFSMKKVSTQVSLHLIHKTSCGIGMSFFRNYNRGKKYMYTTEFAVPLYQISTICNKTSKLSLVTQKNNFECGWWRSLASAGTKQRLWQYQTPHLIQYLVLCSIKYNWQSAKGNWRPWVFLWNILGLQ